MATEETGEAVLANEIFGDLRIAPVPEGTRTVAAFLMLKLDDGGWSARSVGDYDRVAFLGALASYTHALTVDEAQTWFVEEDD